MVRWLSSSEALSSAPPVSQFPVSDVLLIELVAAVARLPEVEQKVLFLRIESGLNCQQIASVMNTQKDAIELHLQKARESLRTALPPTTLELLRRALQEEASHA